MGPDPLPAAARLAEAPRAWGATRVLRVLVGAMLVWSVGTAVFTPALRTLCAPLAIVILGATLWQPRWGLTLLATLAPAGSLLVAAPARAAELLAWTFLAGCLLRVWRPLTASQWPRAVTLPAILFAATLGASWLMLTLGEAAGIDPLAWPQFLFRSLPLNHLFLTSPEPETWTLLQSLAGIAVFLVAVAITRESQRGVQLLAGGLAISAAVLAIATLADVHREWAAVDYGWWYLRRFVDGERFSLHLTDFNAAASVYVLGGVAAAALAAGDRPRRLLWIAAILPVLPALALAGSLSALAAAAVGGAATLGARRWRHTRGQIAAVVAVVVLAVAVSALLASRRGEGRATASEALSLRSQFLETSARMFASAPVTGVGIGRYFDRSAEFMPERLREMYGNENAHNYFAQQFAELGLVGGLLFIWLAAAPLTRGWRRIRSSPVGEGALLGLFGGASAYLMTSLTGHPLLVPEAAIPFWAALGALGGGSSGTERTEIKAPHAAAATVVLLVLAGGVGLAALSSTRTEAVPPERGFHGFEADAQERRFRWMTRHAVTYVPSGPGIVTIQLRAPDGEPRARPLIVETAIAGRVVDRREIGAEWVTINLGVRESGHGPFRRIDLRANQQWMQDVRLGIRPAQRPISVMVGEVGWTPVDPVR